MKGYLGRLIDRVVPVQQEAMATIPRVEPSIFTREKIPDESGEDPFEVVVEEPEAFSEPVPRGAATGNPIPAAPMKWATSLESVKSQESISEPLQDNSTIQRTSTVNESKPNSLAKTASDESKPNLFAKPASDESKSNPWHSMAELLYSLVPLVGFPYPALFWEDSEHSKPQALFCVFQYLDCRGERG